MRQSVTRIFLVYLIGCLSTVDRRLPKSAPLIWGGGSCRRQWKSAAPDGPAWWTWLVGLGVYRHLLDERDDQGEGAGRPASQPPGPRARFCDTSRAKWGVRGLGAGRAKSCSGAGEGASCQESCSRLHQSTISTSHESEVAKGGPGREGWTCKIVLWWRRGRIS